MLLAITAISRASLSVKDVSVVLRRLQIFIDSMETSRNLLNTENRRIAKNVTLAAFILAVVLPSCAAYRMEQAANARLSQSATAAEKSDSAMASLRRQLPGRRRTVRSTSPPRC